MYFISVTVLHVKWINWGWPMKQIEHQQQFHLLQLLQCFSRYKPLDQTQQWLVCMWIAWSTHGVYWTYHYCKYEWLQVRQHLDNGWRSVDIPNMQSVTYTVQFLSSGTHRNGQVQIDISNVLGYQTVPIFCRQPSNSVNLSLIFISP